MPDGNPNYLTVASDGSVGALFPGGVQLPNSNGSTPGVAKKVTWVRDDTGTLVAEIKNYRIDGANPQYETSLTTKDPAIANSEVTLRESYSEGFAPDKAFLIAKCAEAVNNAQRTILTENGKSAFWQGGNGGTLKRLRLAGYYYTGNLAVGWTTYGLTQQFGDASDCPNVLPIYSVYSPNGASIISDHCISYSASAISVAVNSTILQSGCFIMGLLVGWSN